MLRSTAAANTPTRKVPSASTTISRLETCRDRFAKVVNFRGFPHIPGQDTVIRYPNRGDANSGDVL
jgi:hypothetical protein